MLWPTSSLFQYPKGISDHRVEWMVSSSFCKDKQSFVPANKGNTTQHIRITNVCGSNTCGIEGGANNKRICIIVHSSSLSFLELLILSNSTKWSPTIVRTNLFFLAKSLVWLINVLTPENHVKNLLNKILASDWVIFNFLETCCV